MRVKLFVQDLREHTDQWTGLDAYCEMSVRSEALRRKVHAFDIPDIKTLGRYSDGSLIYHLQSGLSDARQVSDAIEAHLTPREGGLSILDFGCGLGRLLRYFAQFAPEHRYWACDVNRGAVDWCAKAIAGVRAVNIAPAPPARLPDGE